MSKMKWKDEVLSLIQRKEKWILKSKEWEESVESWAIQYSRDPDIYWSMDEWVALAYTDIRVFMSCLALAIHKNKILNNSHLESIHDLVKPSEEDKNYDPQYIESIYKIQENRIQYAVQSSIVLDLFNIKRVDRILQCIKEVVKKEAEASFEED